MTDHARHYAFPHGGANSRHRLELFAERFDPLTVRLALTGVITAFVVMGRAVVTTQEERNSRRQHG